MKAAMKRSGLIVEKSNKSIVSNNIKNTDVETYSNNSLYTQNTDEEEYENYDDNDNNYDSVLNTYKNSNNSSLNDVRHHGHGHDHDNLSNNVLCEYCNTDNNKLTSNHIILSCNHIFHVKCLMDKFNVLYNDNDNKMFEFNENMINNKFYESHCCLKCKNKLNYEDIFSIYSKHVSSNKGDINDYDKKIDKLKDQRKKIENEIKCLNDYISKLQAEKQASQMILTKTFSLLYK